MEKVNKTGPYICEINEKIKILINHSKELPATIPIKKLLLPYTSKSAEYIPVYIIKEYLNTLNDLTSNSCFMATRNTSFVGFTNTDYLEKEFVIEQEKIKQEIISNIITDLVNLDSKENNKEKEIVIDNLAKEDEEITKTTSETNNNSNRPIKETEILIVDFWLKQAKTYSYNEYIKLKEKLYGKDGSKIKTEIRKPTKKEECESSVKRYKNIFSSNSVDKSGTIERIASQIDTHTFTKPNTSREKVTLPKGMTILDILATAFTLSVCGGFWGFWHYNFSIMYAAVFACCGFVAGAMMDMVLLILRDAKKDLEIRHH